MQRTLTGLGYRLYDTTFNVNSNPADYVGIFLLVIEFYAEFSRYRQLDDDHRFLKNTFRAFLDPQRGEYSENVRHTFYERKEFHRLRPGVGLADVYEEMKSFQKQITAMPTYRAPDPLSTYKDKTNRYKIKISRNFVRDMHNLNPNISRRFIEKYFAVIAQGCIKDASYIKNHRRYGED